MVISRKTFRRRQLGDWGPRGRKCPQAGTHIRAKVVLDLDLPSPKGTPKVNFPNRSRPTQGPDLSIRDRALPCMLMGPTEATGRREADHARKPKFADHLFPHSDDPDRSARPGTTRAFLLGLGLDGARNVSKRRKPTGLTQEAFDNLLAFLGSTPEEAGKKYEEIRRRLIKIFASRGCTKPEELVDETIDRVARKASELAPTYEGDPALYFYGVARWVYLEWIKKKPVAAMPPEPDANEDHERELDCLEKCAELLPPEQSAFIRDYYREDQSAKREPRRALAERLGIGINALRLRAFRIRAELQKCVIACLELSEEGAPTP